MFISVYNTMLEYLKEAMKTLNEAILNSVSNITLKHTYSCSVCRIKWLSNYYLVFW